MIGLRITAAGTVVLVAGLVVLFGAVAAVVSGVVLIVAGFVVPWEEVTDAKPSLTAPRSSRRR